MINYHHVTLNTGHVTNAELPPVADIAEDYMLPLLDAGGGQIPGDLGLYIWFLRANDTAHSAFFQISKEPGQSKKPMVMAIGCGDKTLNYASWKQVLGSYTALTPGLKKLGFWKAAPKQPPMLPWLAVWLTPFILTANPETIGLLGGIEQAIMRGILTK